MPFKQLAKPLQQSVFAERLHTRDRPAPRAVVTPALSLFETQAHWPLIIAAIGIGAAVPWVSEGVSNALVSALRARTWALVQQQWQTHFAQTFRSHDCGVRRVQKPQRCVECFGTTTVLCGVCRARGRVGGVFDGEQPRRCTVCEGTGRIQCPRCRGAGMRNSWLWRTDMTLHRTSVEDRHGPKHDSSTEESY